MVGGVEFVAGDVAIGDSHNLGIALHLERQFVVAGPDASALAVDSSQSDMLQV